MRWAYGIVGLALCLGGCTHTEQDRVRAYNQDGVDLFQRGNYPDARDCFQAALNHAPDDPALLYNLGQCYDRMGSLAKAERLYLRCLEFAPNHEDCRHALHQLLVNTGRSKEAGAQIAAWMLREPALAGPYAEDGWLLRLNGDLPAAQARLQQALERNPHHERALVELGQVYEGLNRPDRARVIYERVLERDPQQTAVAQRINYLMSKGAGKPKPE